MKMKIGPGMYEKENAGYTIRSNLVRWFQRLDTYEAESKLCPTAHFGVSSFGRSSYFTGECDI